MMEAAELPVLSAIVPELGRAIGAMVLLMIGA
jgi:hypothetical protein